MCLQLKTEMKGKYLNPPVFSKAVPAALKCAEFVGLHLAVRLIPSQPKMKTCEGAVNPHKNFILFYFISFFFGG